MSVTLSRPDCVLILNSETWISIFSLLKSIFTPDYGAVEFQGPLGSRECHGGDFVQTRIKAFKLTASCPVIIATEPEPGQRPVLCLPSCFPRQELLALLQSCYSGGFDDKSWLNVTYNILTTKVSK